MTISIQSRILSALRARGLTGTDDELMSLTFFDIATAIALKEFDAGAEKFTGEIMDRIQKVDQGHRCGVLGKCDGEEAK